MPQLIEDSRFENGFFIHGPRHGDGYTGRILCSGKQPSWRIAQWGVYRHPIKSTPESESVSISTVCEGDVKLALKSQNEYCGHLREKNEDWPHLLVEQFFDGSCVDFGKVKELNYRCSFKLNYCNSLFERSLLNDKLHGAQVHHFFKISCKNTGDFFWLGIPYFDTRYYMFDGYFGIDGGKADAGNMLIYIPPQKPFTNESTHKKTWITYNTDILPYIKEAYFRAKSHGFFDGFGFDDMVLTSTNFGFEMFSGYDGEFEIKDLEINAKE